MVMERILVPSDRVHDTVSGYIDQGYRIMTMFAEEGGTIDIVMRKSDSIVAIYYDIEDRAVPLSDIAWNASVYERLMSEMSGIAFPYSNKGAIIYRQKGEGHPLQKGRYDRSTEVRIPISKNRTVGDDIFEITAREFAVWIILGILLHVHIYATVAHVSVALVHNLLHKSNLLNDMSAGMWFDRRWKHIQQFHIAMVAVGEVLHHLHWLKLLQACFFSYLILTLISIVLQVAYVGDVTHIAHLITQMEEITI